MAWTISDGQACYSGVAGVALAQVNVFDVGKLYSIVIQVEDLTQGKLNIPSIENTTEISENGTFQFIGKAIFTDLLISPFPFGEGVFDGCIQIVEVLEIPYYSILDSDNNVIFTLDDTTGVTADNGYVQYQIDWTGISEGTYYLKFTVTGLDYITDCFHVKLLHDCTIQIEWDNNSDAFGFNYSGLDFTQSLRINAKLWKPSYKANDKEFYEYSNGDLEILYVSKSKEITFTTEELPEYIHDALQIAVDSDNFFVNGVKYVFTEDEYSPSWRNSSQLASVELPLRRSQNLRNSNC